MQFARIKRPACTPLSKVAMLPRRTFQFYRIFKPCSFLVSRSSFLRPRKFSSDFVNVVPKSPKTEDLLFGDQIAFGNLPSHFWTIEKTSQFLKFIEPKLGVNTTEDWYKIKPQQFKQVGGHVGRSLLGKYSSLRKAITAVYPTIHWDDIKFATQRGAFKDSVNQRRLLDTASKELGIQHWHDWYSITRTQLFAVSCGKQIRSVMNWYHSDSLAEMLKNLYPEHSWDFLRFRRMPRGAWDDVQQQRRFFQELGKQMGISTPSESWYQVSRQKVVELGGARARTLLGYHSHSLRQTLASLFPDFAWDATRFLRTPQRLFSEASQRRSALERVARDLKLDGEPLDPRSWEKILQKDILKCAQAQALLRWFRTNRNSEGKWIDLVKIIKDENL